MSGQRPDPRSADLGTPKTQKEFLFLVLFLLDKGEKGQLSALKSKRAVAFLRFLELMRQTDMMVKHHMNEKQIAKKKKEVYN